MIRAYIQNQEKEDPRLDQLGLFEKLTTCRWSENLFRIRFERFTFSSLRLCRRSLTFPVSCCSLSFHERHRPTSTGVGAQGPLAGQQG